MRRPDVGDYLYKMCTQGVEVDCRFVGGLVFGLVAGGIRAWIATWSWTTASCSMSV